MPLSRLENFLVNTDGNILYVNPSDLDATDSFDNKGNSLTRPFVTIQRALIEAARFTYQSGFNNDKFDRTTVLLYPGEHIVDNRPGLRIKDDGSLKLFKESASGDDEEVTGLTDLELKNSSEFNLNEVDNILYKFNSVHGGVIVPKGTSIVGLDLRKTKVRPLYVPNPDVEDDVIARSALFRVTGGCYFWQFSMFDANRSVYYSKNFTEKRNPNISHHKLTCFEYADGINKVSGYTTTDLQQYYFKLMVAYGPNTGNRVIPSFPTNKDFEPNTPESKIVGDLSPNDNKIDELTSSGLSASALTQNAHGLTVDDQILITGVGSTDLYNGTYRVTGVSSDRKFDYKLNSDAIDDTVSQVNLQTAKVIIEADTVTGASPYIFNCSLRSVFGMCGLHADGSKSTGFKSMVVAQFTGIGLQKDDKAFVIYNENSGDYLNSVNAAAAGFDTPLYLNPKSEYRNRYDNFHIKVSNDAFIQAVSVFAIGFSNHFLAESGGEQSITNSNSNFGNKSLVSKGFKPNAFNRDDTGYVTHIVPPKDLQKEETNIVWRSLDPVTTVSSATTSRLYIDGEKDITNPPNSIINGFRIGAKIDDKLFLNVTVDGENKTFSSPILMQVESGDGPISEKKFTIGRVGVANSITNGVISLTTNHNLLKGESIRIFSDDGRTPDGIEIGRKYFAIPQTNTTQIKLANTVNDALSDKAIVENINTKGGILTVQSTVNDKIPGEIGHPIQYDETEKNWYILSSSTTTTNKIYEGIVGFSTQIEDNNSATYVTRKSETRALNDRIYRLRYVIPKDFAGANVAKKPEKNYVLQESKTVGEESAITNIITNRNPKIIAGIGTDASDSTKSIVTTEISHKLSVGDRVRISKVRSSTNTTGVGNSGYNGLFTVSSTPSSKTFTYTNTNLNFGVAPESFVGVVTDARANANNLSLSDLPVFSRSEYDTTYTVQEVETIQDYVSTQQDGIYYLTCLIGNLSPTVSEFSELKYKQSFLNLYPTVDKDNPNNDPVQSISAASNKDLGKITLNNPLNSITKEATINYLRDNRIGFAVTFAESNNSGITTLTSDIEHNLNAITGLSIDSAGSGYGNDTTRYNLTLTDQSSGNGNGATVKAVTNASGNITSIEIIDGGSAYGIGQTLAIDGGTSGVASVTSINNCVNNVIQVIGVGETTNRTNGAFNGLYKITGVPSTKSVTYTHVQKGQTSGTSAGIYTGPVNSTSGIFTLLDEAIGITNIVGVADTTLTGTVTVTTSSNHNLAVGNKIKVAGLTGLTASTYNGTDFVVKEIVGVTTFTMKSPIGISTSGESGAELYRYSLNSFGQDSSLASEKIAGALSPLATGIGITITSTSGIATAGNNSGESSVNVADTTAIKPGDFLQVGNEIVRVKSKSTSNTTGMTVFRGALGTQSVSHEKGELIRKINVIPSELHRFSSIRASGHTFEYIGYGPGNYSTSLPQKITKQIEPDKELLAISREEKGGVTFFSGMNDRGDFFSGQKEEPKELFLGDASDSNFAIFDDVFIRNTLRVGGGPNQNLPSEFNGPVNFTNKITSTDFEDGIEAIKLLVKGNALNNPLFQVGEDAKPSFIVNKDSQKVGINTLNPNTNIELDVDGTIRANVYENFKLTDLPDATEETTYARNRIIKVKDDGSGYEMIDPHELSAYELRSLGVSNDGTIYVGTGSVVSSKLQISGISTSNFFVGERVKIFGVTASGDNTVVPDPVQIKDATVKSVTVVPSTGFSTAATYYYWQAQYHMKNGKVGIASQIDPDSSYSTGGPYVGVANTATIKNGIVIPDFNNDNHNVLKVSRSDTNHGILIYRQNFGTDGDASDADVNEAKLIAVLGQKELGSATGQISWIDYGVYEQPFWSAKGTVNEFLGNDGDTTETNQIHFPTIVGVGTTTHRRGWDISEVTEIGSGNITVAGNFQTNGTTVGGVGFGTNNTVKVVHDNTKALADAIAGITAAGGFYLDLPSGTYLTNKLVIPTKFTLTGTGKNSIIKQQYYATDANSVGTGGTSGTSLPFNGNLVGVAITNPTDITISDITFDGNSSNNLMFELDNENNLVTFEGGTSMLFKDMEIRNSSGGGFYARNSRRISVENSTIVDGGQTERFNIRPLDVQNSETVRINDCLFENFAGPIDVSVTTVVSTGGNIIRNCGSGIDAYATGKINTQNNVILGPSDEFIATPDIYDTDFDSVNITIQSHPAASPPEFLGPALLFVEDGEGKDLSRSKVTVTAGIGTMVGLFSTTRTAGLGETFVGFDVFTQDNTPDGLGRENGYVQLKLPSARIVSAGLTAYAGAGVTNSTLGYQIIGEEYIQNAGVGTFIGISTAYWANGAGYGAANGGYVNNPVSTATTQYVIKLSDPSQESNISVGDFVQLPNHDMTPAIGLGLPPNSKDENNNTIANPPSGLRVDKKISGGRIVLTGFTVTKANHVDEDTKSDDYISIRRIFTIAKGRVGVI